MKVTRPGESTLNEWRYVQPETGAVFRGLSYWGMRDAVFAHRKAMGLDTGSGWEARFQDDLCKQNEQVACDRDKNAPRPMSQSVTLDDLKRFMTTLVNQRGDFVSKEEAERRAAICSTCPKNQVVRGCWGCFGISKLVGAFLKGSKTSRDTALDSCSVCKCVLRAKVWLKLDTIDNSGLEYPDHCWQKAESKPSDSAEA